MICGRQIMRICEKCNIRSCLREQLCGCPKCKMCLKTAVYTCTRCKEIFCSQGCRDSHQSIKPEFCDHPTLSNDNQTVCLKITVLQETRTDVWERKDYTIYRKPHVLLRDFIGTKYWFPNALGIDLDWSVLDNRFPSIFTENDPNVKKKIICDAFHKGQVSVQLGVTVKNKNTTTDDSRRLYWDSFIKPKKEIKLPSLNTRDKSSTVSLKADSRSNSGATLDFTRVTPYFSFVGYANSIVPNAHSDIFSYVSSVAPSAPPMDVASTLDSTRVTPYFSSVGSFAFSNNYSGLSSGSSNPQIDNSSFSSSLGSLAGSGLGSATTNPVMSSAAGGLGFIQSQGADNISSNRSRKRSGTNPNQNPSGS